MWAAFFELRVGVAEAGVEECCAGEALQARCGPFGGLRRGRFGGVEEAFGDGECLVGGLGLGGVHGLFEKSRSTASALISGSGVVVPSIRLWCMWISDEAQETRRSGGSTSR
ncbi:hypothetical protein GCM10020001_113370 [Nonomuraea salmonea]